ncbi:MAG TPA: hypothetical protein VF503_12200 [Sphingobium sp.]|uniref:hypothetical protein n=1 Tax=Sphingobium sp. TaxID=1912891 RepID=UPI002ED0E277
MADMTDVGEALVAVVAGAAYPTGTSQPSVIDAPVMVYQGWPDPKTLEADLKAGKVHVSVFPTQKQQITNVVMGDMEWVEDSNDGTTGELSQETRRQTKAFQITIWANAPALRDPLARILDSVLSGITRLALMDGTTGMLSYIMSQQHDERSSIMIFRRDLFYNVNYATIQVLDAYTILNTQTNMAAAINDTMFGPPITVTTNN